jgi:calcineurin-like phosphoesterase family protein
MGERKIVVQGNHDLPRHTKELLKHVESVCGALDYKGFCLTHIPIAEQELTGRHRGNIHGHLHKNIMLRNSLMADYLGQPDYRYFNVCCDVLNFTPITLIEIIEKMNENKQ